MSMDARHITEKGGKRKTEEKKKKKNKKKKKKKGGQRPPLSQHNIKYKRERVYYIINTSLPI